VRQKINEDEGESNEFRAERQGRAGHWWCRGYRHGVLQGTGRSRGCDSPSPDIDTAAAEAAAKALTGAGYKPSE